MSTQTPKTMKKAPNTRKKLLHHLVYNVMCVEKGDPLDKVLNTKNCTIRSSPSLLSLSRINLINLSYKEDGKDNLLNPDEFGAIEQLQKYA